MHCCYETEVWRVKTCKTCRWYYEEVCCNGDSEHRADFRLGAETREKWEENKCD